jgi:hypothetical protein
MQQTWLNLTGALCDAKEQVDQVRKSQLRATCLMKLLGTWLTRKIRKKQQAASSLPNQSPSGNGLSREGEVVSKPKNLESSREKSSGDSSSLNIKYPKGDKPTHSAVGDNDSKKSTADQAKKNTPDSSSSIYNMVIVALHFW